MPRKKAPPQDMLEDAHGNPIMPAVVVRHEREAREKHIDPYLALEGGSKPTDEPHKPKRKRGGNKKTAIQKELAAAQQGVRQRENRYDMYLDAMVGTGGNRVAALAVVFKISEQEAVDRYNELLAEVQRGIPTSSVTEVLERNDVTTHARVKVLRRHLYGPIPAASLKAAEMLADLDDRPAHSGTRYEHYIRMVMAEE